MGDREVWVKDVNDLRDLGRRDMKNFASDVQNTIGELKTLILSAAAFGENQDIQRQIMTAYENARAAIIKQVEHAQKGMSSLHMVDVIFGLDGGDLPEIVVSVTARRASCTTGTNGAWRTSSASSDLF